MNVILSVIAVRGIDAEVDNGVLALDLLKLKTRLPEITRISIEQISGNVTKAPSEYGVLGTGLNEFG